MLWVAWVTRQKMSTYHRSVLLHESLEALGILPEGVYVDVTFGGGGHSNEILKRLGPAGKLIAFDQDEDAVKNAPDDPRFTLVKKNFSELKNSLHELGITQVNGVLADLGVSSHQFDTAERGFSIRFDGPLDMRMNQESELTAEVVLNTYDAQHLKQMFRLYGEVENAGLLVKRISEARSNATIETIEQLRQILTPLSRKGKENQYMAKVFQALRIEVNAELEVLREMLTQASDILMEEGRLVVISYHSLEDRLAKNFFRSGNFEGNQVKDFYGNLIRPLEPLESKPMIPSDEEIEHNTRARSAKMRVATKNTSTS
jgi:16S rRNA (cytosine1402-N4)-methyltransferase